MIHFVVTCTNRKTEAAGKEYLARDLGPGTVGERCARWAERLERERVRNEASLPAADLYSGNLWQSSRALAQSVPGSQLWICSAGYGLLRPTDKVRSYGATFSLRHEDSVGSTVSDVGEWWSELNGLLGPVRGTPRSIKELVTSKPTDGFLLVLSESYVDALSNDLRATVHSVGNPDRLAIVASGAHAHDDINAFVLPTDARWQAIVGGARQSLNARIALWLLSKPNGHAFSRNRLMRLVEATNAELEPLKTWDREAQSDEEIRKYIGAELQLDGQVTKSRLLRRLRDSGRACEQSRFSDLFAEAGGRTQ